MFDQSKTEDDNTAKVLHGCPDTTDLWNCLTHEVGSPITTKFKDCSLSGNNPF